MCLNGERGEFKLLLLLTLDGVAVPATEFYDKLS
jgi:hypothetical protein